MTAPAKHPLMAFKEGLDRRADQLKHALPAHIPVERFVRVVLTAVQHNPKLLSCSQESLWNACMKAAQDGLLPDGRDGAIVPYGETEDGRKGADIAQWMPMIGGLRKKVRNSGEILTWEAHCVYENDAFEYELGDESFIRHKPCLDDRGKIIAAYSIAKLKDGSLSREIMSIREIEGVRSKSKAKKGPWADPIFYPEMCRKTVARRHSKVLPMSTDLDDLVRRDDELYDFGADKQRPQIVNLDTLQVADHSAPERRPAPPPPKQSPDKEPTPSGGGSAGADVQKADDASGDEGQSPPADTADDGPSELETGIANSLIDCKTAADVDAVAKMFHDDIKAASREVQDAILQQLANVREAMANRGDLFPGGDK